MVNACLNISKLSVALLVVSLFAILRVLAAEVWPSPAGGAGDIHLRSITSCSSTANNGTSCSCTTRSYTRVYFVIMDIHVNVPAAFSAVFSRRQE